MKSDADLQAKKKTTKGKKTDKSKTVYAPALPSLMSAPNTKVSNMLDTLLEKGEQAVDVGKGILTRIKVYYMPLTDEESGTVRFRSPQGKSKDYTEFDRAVLGAVSSLVQAGNSVIIPSTIARLITGCVNMRDVSEEFLRQICDSLEKQMFIFVELDYTEELKRKHPDADISSARARGWLLPHTEHEVVAGGYNVQGYVVTGCPILFEYANAIDQVLPIPMEYLAVGGSNNAERVALKHYMLRRILAKTTKMQNTILFSTLYEKAGITDTSTVPRTQLKRVRDYIHRCLTEWVQLGLLTDFAYSMSKNNSYYSITFIRPSKEQPQSPLPDSLPPEPTENPPEIDEPRQDEGFEAMSDFSLGSDAFL